MKPMYLGVLLFTIFGYKINAIMLYNRHYSELPKCKW